MNKNKYGFVFYIMIILMIFGCQNNSKNTPFVTEASSDESTSSDVLNPSQEKTMVATVNDATITRGEVDMEKTRMLQQFGQQLSPEQMQQLQPMLEQQAIENLVIKSLLVQQIKNEKIQADQKAVEEQLNDLKKRFPSPEQYQEQLKAANMTEDDLREEIVENIKVENLLSKQFDSIESVTEKEITDYYSNNPNEFKTNEQIKASHILITVDENDTDETKTKKKQSLIDLKKQIENGSDFAELAKANSDCPSKSNGGDLGFFERGQMVKPFEDTAFSLKPGQLSDIVETQFGYHLIKVTDHKNGGTTPLEEIKDQLQAKLENDRKQEKAQEYVEELRNKATITYAEQKDKPGKPVETDTQNS